MEDLVSRCQLDHRAEVHDADAVGDVLDDGQVVRDEHVGQILLFLQIEQQVDDLRLNGHVQRGDSLVADDELRLRGERAGDADTLPLAAGELVREAVQEVRCKAAVVHDLQDHLLHTGVLFLDHVVRLHAFADNLADAHARVQRGIRILENQLHVAAQAAHLVILESGKVDAVVAVGFVLLEFGVVCIRGAQRLNLFAASVKLRAQSSNLVVTLLQLFLRSLQLAVLGRLARFLSSFLRIFRVVYVYLQFLPLFLHGGQIVCNGVILGIGRNHGIEIINHEEAADDLCDIQQRILCQLAGSVEFAVLGVLLLLGELGVFCFKLVALLLQLSEFCAAGFKIFDSVNDVFRCQIVQRTAIVHGTAIGLVIQLKNRAAKGGLAAAGLADKAERFALVDIQRNAVVSLDETAALQGEILLQVADAKQNLLVIILHVCPPSSRRSSEPAGCRRRGSVPAPPPDSAQSRTCSAGRICSPWADPAGAEPRRGSLQAVRRWGYPDAGWRASGPRYRDGNTRSCGRSSRRVRIRRPGRST